MFGVVGIKKIKRKSNLKKMFQDDGLIQGFFCRFLTIYTYKNIKQLTHSVAL